MRRFLGTTTAAVAFLMVLSAMAVGQTTFLSEDFSTGVGQTPPAGWSSSDLVNATSSASPLWRFDNPDNRTINSPLTAPVAICDTDNSGSGNVIAHLQSPNFDASTAGTVILAWDQHHQPLGSTVSVYVRDGLGGFTQVYTDSAGTAVDDSQTVDITAACGGSATCSIVFEYDGNFDWWWMVDNVSISEPPPGNDVGVSAIISPAEAPGDCLTLTNAEVVEVEITNYGLNGIQPGTMIPVTYRRDATPPVTEIFTVGAVISSGGTANYAFATPSNFSGNPFPHTLLARTSLAGDLDPSNDFLTGYQVDNTPTISTFPYSENFDSYGATNGGTTVPPMWVNDPNDNAGTSNQNWFSRNTGTGSSGTGPNGDCSTGSTFYMYVEDSGNLDAVSLLTPCIDMSSTATPTLAFCLHSLNGNTMDMQENSISVDVLSYPGAVETLDVLGPLGEVSLDQDDWTLQTADLSAFTAGTVRLRFRVNSNNGSFRHDIAIDDVNIIDGFVNSIGQPPQPGVAVFNINGATDANGFGLGLGGNGPFFTSVAETTNLVMTFQGEANQVIVLFTGPLNPAADMFPPYGQLDVGTPDGMGGYPDVAIVADGNVPQFPDLLFFIGPAGTSNMSFPVPVGLAGMDLDLQATIFNSTSIFGFSNAVRASIVP